MNVIFFLRAMAIRLDVEKGNSPGYYNNPMKYASIQPMPIIFGVTIAVIVIGLAFVERIGHRTYKQYHSPAEHARKLLIQAGFKRLNGNSPAVENKRFYSAFNPIPPPRRER